MCTHTKCVLIQCDSYKVCTHRKCVLIQNVYSYIMCTHTVCTHTKCVLIQSVYSKNTHTKFVAVIVLIKLVPYQLTYHDRCTFPLKYELDEFIH